MKSTTIHRVIVLHVATMSIVLFVILTAHGSDMQITEDKAVWIANTLAKNLGYDVESMRVEATHYTTPSNKYLAGHREGYYDNERNSLQGKKYWIVYSYNPKFKKGGDIIVFIDSSNGEIIFYILGK
jgi:hypothetical protein